ncbi:HpaA family protein [Desulfurobacterium indicum]|uniref:Neuraminyllactose-binding hemagglutinin n=1 Tax=Desulfurobacterium indicum TaxID=1914305 RepID=A0A1R1MKS6_9BACT|nr:HpaA family protein [Desulfurobacterium indicum]OMH40366.1 hypothetical protein BLW93_05735 [Desulfurobacterium indicum]
MEGSNEKKFLTGAILIGVLLSSCASTIPVKRVTTQLNLETPQVEEQPKTKKIIGIVSPSQYFKEYYEDKLKKALQTAIQEILIKKGFTLKGPYETFDDITYQDKKKIYLTLIPEINLDIKKVVEENKCNNLYCSEKGKLYFGGDVTVTLIEPLTRQVFMKKRINLSDANIVDPYTYQYQINNRNKDLITDLVSKATAPKELIDSRDKAMAEGINRFYKYAVSKLNKYLDREELLSFEKDVEQVKHLKRF